MRYRYNFLRFTIGRWKRKSMAEVNRDMNIKFTKAEILALVCMALIFLAIYIPHEVASGIIALIAMACYVVATVWDCFNYGPITRWRHATIKSAIGATLWTVMPIIIYLFSSLLFSLLTLFDITNIIFPESAQHFTFFN